MKLKDILNKICKISIVIDAFSFILLLASLIVSLVNKDLFFLCFIALGLATISLVVSIILIKKKINMINNETNKFQEDVKNELYLLETQQKGESNNSAIQEFKDINAEINQVRKVFEGRDYLNLDLSSSNLNHDCVFDGVLTLASFKDELNNALTKTNLYRLALCLISLDEPNNNFSKEVFYKLKDAIKEQLNPQYIGLYNENTYAVYFTFVSSISTSKYKLENLVKSFHYVKNVEDSVIVYGAKVGISFYPYVSKNELFKFAEVALAKSQGVNVYLPEYSTEFIIDLKDLSLQEKYRRSIAVLEKLKYLVSNADTTAKLLDTMKYGIMSIVNLFGIDDGGILEYNPIDKTYHCIYEYARNEKNFTFSLLKDFTKEEFHDFEMMFDNDGSFYGTIHDDFPVPVRSLLDNLNIEYFYDTRIESFNDTLGYIFLHGTNSKPCPFTIQDKQCLFSLTNFIAMTLARKRLLDKNMRSDAFISALLRREQKYAYAIDEKDYSLTYVSDNLAKKYKNAYVGNKCYKAFDEELDGPCVNCPLKEGRTAILRPLIGESLFASILTRHYQNKKETCIMIENVEPVDNNISSKELSPLLQIFNKLRYTRDINEALKNQQKTGYILLFTINDYANLVKKISKIPVNKALILLVKRLQSYGYDNSIYHYNDSTLAFNYDNGTHKLILDEAEKIYSILKEEIILDDNMKLDLGYKAGVISYPNDFISESVTSLTEKVLAKMEKMEEGRLFEEGVKNYRALDRKKYVLECIDDAVLKDTFEIYIQPIIDVKTNTPYAGEVLLRLNDKERGQIPPREFVSLASQTGRMFQVEQSIIAAIGNLYRNHGLGIFSSRGVNHLSINISEDSALNPLFFEKVSQLNERYKFPSKFLRFEFQAKLLKNHIEWFKDLFAKLHSINITVSMDGFNMDNDVNEVLTKLDLDEVKLGYNCVREFSNNVRPLSSFDYLRDLSNTKGFTFTGEGIEKENQIELLKKLNITSLQGYYFAKPMPKEEYIKYLNFGN